MRRALTLLSLLLLACAWPTEPVAGQVCTSARFSKTIRNQVIPFGKDSAHIVYVFQDSVRSRCQFPKDTVRIPDSTVTPPPPPQPPDTTKPDTTQPPPPPPPPPSAAHPNEPAGFTPSRALDGSALLPFPGATSAKWVGKCYGYPTGDPDLTIAQTPEGPALQTRFFTGLKAGNAPVDWGCFDAQNRELSKVYYSVWVRILGTDYANEAVGTKVGFLGHGRGTCCGENESTLFLVGTGTSNALQSAMMMQWKVQAPGQTNYSQNLTGRALMTVGPWHHWEIIAELNDVGQANGRVRFWIDGTPVMDHRNVTFRAATCAGGGGTVTCTHGFGIYKWNPTWGGGVGSRTRDDFIQVRDFYLSGVP